MTVSKLPCFEEEKETKFVKSTPALGKATSDGLEIGEMVLEWFSVVACRSRGKLSTS